MGKNRQKFSQKTVNRGWVGKGSEMPVPAIPVPASCVRWSISNDIVSAPLSSQHQSPATRYKARCPSVPASINHSPATEGTAARLVMVPAKLILGLLSSHTPGQQQIAGDPGSINHGSSFNNSSLSRSGVATSDVKIWEVIGMIMNDIQ